MKEETIQTLSCVAISKQNIAWVDVGLNKLGTQGDLGSSESFKCHRPCPQGYAESKLQPGKEDFH